MVCDLQASILNILLLVALIASVSFELVHRRRRLTIPDEPGMTVLVSMNGPNPHSQ